MPIYRRAAMHKWKLAQEHWRVRVIDTVQITKFASTHARQATAPQNIPASYTGYITYTFGGPVPWCGWNCDIGLRPGQVSCHRPTMNQKRPNNTPCARERRCKLSRLGFRCLVVQLAVSTHSVHARSCSAHNQCAWHGPWQRRVTCSATLGKTSNRNESVKLCCAVAT